MNIYEFYGKLCEKYPEHDACSWDNDGIMVTPGAICDISSVLVSLDPTEDAVNYAAENGFDVVLTHHPLIFSPLKRVTPEAGVGRKVIFALMNDISVISLHTRLDVADGGVNDCLAAALDLREISKFGDDECPTMGRIGSLASPMEIERFASFVKERLGSDCVRFAASGDEVISRVAVLGGAGKGFVYAAKAAGADVLVTGEASYNSYLDSREDSIPVMTAGHFYTENVVTHRLAADALEILGSCRVEVFNSAKITTV